MTVYEYVISRHGTVHLMPQVAGFGKTLCGRKVGATWHVGDETTSGLAATCETCKGKVWKYDDVTHVTRS